MFRTGKPEALIKHIEGLHPSKRLGKPEEVASVVAMMAGPDAQWVNGQNIRVNGVSLPPRLSARRRDADFRVGFHSVERRFRDGY